MHNDGQDTEKNSGGILSTDSTPQEERITLGKKKVYTQIIKSEKTRYRDIHNVHIIQIYYTHTYVMIN